MVGAIVQEGFYTVISGESVLLYRPGVEGSCLDGGSAAFFASHLVVFSHLRG